MLHSYMCVVAVQQLRCVLDAPGRLWKWMPQGVCVLGVGVCVYVCCKQQGCDV